MFSLPHIGVISVYEQLFFLIKNPLTKSWIDGCLLVTISDVLNIRPCPPIVTVLISHEKSPVWTWSVGSFNTSCRNLWIRVGSGLVIMNNYILLYNHWKFCCFSSFQFSNYLLFNKGISSITSSVQKKTAQERTKETNTYNSFKTWKLPSINIFPAPFCNFTSILEITKKKYI